MISVTIHYPHVLAEYTNCNSEQITLPAHSVGEVLTFLCNRYGSDFARKVRPMASCRHSLVTVIVNDEIADESKRVATGDDIRLVIAIGGGSGGVSRVRVLEQDPEVRS